MIEKKKLLMMQLLMTMIMIMILFGLWVFHIFDLFKGLQLILACLIGFIGVCSLFLSLYKMLSNGKETIRTYRR